MKFIKFEFGFQNISCLRLMPDRVMTPTTLQKFQNISCLRLMKTGDTWIQILVPEFQNISCLRLILHFLLSIS